MPNVVARFAIADFEVRPGREAHEAQLGLPGTWGN